MCYQDMETLDEFCDTVIEMFKEQEELQNLDAVGICKMNVCYPGIMVGGGTSGRYPGTGQFYRPWELESDQMQEMIRESYKKYMVYFETWNLTLEQCLEWRSACEENGLFHYLGIRSKEKLERIEEFIPRLNAEE